jgi:hypothetical protein
MEVLHRQRSPACEKPCRSAAFADKLELLSQRGNP